MDLRTCYVCDSDEFVFSSNLFLNLFSAKTAFFGRNWPNLQFLAQKMNCCYCTVISALTHLCFIPSQPRGVMVALYVVAPKSWAYMFNCSDFCMSEPFCNSTTTLLSYVHIKLLWWHFHFHSVSLTNVSDCAVINCEKFPTKIKYIFLGTGTCNLRP